MFCGLKGGTPSVHLQRRAETTSQKGLTGCQHLASHWPVDADACFSLVRANQGSAPREDMKTKNETLLIAHAKPMINCSQ